MPFKASDDQTKWQELYLEKHAHFDSLSRVGVLLIPSVLIVVFPLLFLILATGYIIERGINVYVSLALGILTFLIPLIFIGFGTKMVFKYAAVFLAQFHKLPDEEEVKIITGLKVFGKPAFPPPLSGLVKFPEITVKDGKLDPPEHWSSIVGGPVKLKIQPGNAVYIERGRKFSRIVGQGQAFLEWNERIITAINVGPHYETFSTTAWTKDGIKISVEMKGEYFLGRERHEGDENVLIPYDPESIRKAVEYTLKSGKEANEWLKSAVGQTQGAMAAVITKKYLDELFMDGRNQTTLLSTKNIREVVEGVNIKLQEYGVVLSSLQITDVGMSKLIKRERLKTWEMERKHIAMIADGEVKAYQIRMREKARAETQRDLIVSIANSLENVDASNFPEPLLLTLSNFLDHSLESPQIRANIAKESLELLEKMQEILKFPLWLPGEEKNNETGDQRNSGST